MCLRLDKKFESKVLRGKQNTTFLLFLINGVGRTVRSPAAHCLVFQ